MSALSAAERREIPGLYLGVDADQRLADRDAVSRHDAGPRQRSAPSSRWPWRC